MLLWASCSAPHKHDLVKKVEASPPPQKPGLFIIVEMPLALLWEASWGSFLSSHPAVNPPCLCAPRGPCRGRCHTATQASAEAEEAALHVDGNALVFAPYTVISLSSSSLSDRLNPPLHLHTHTDVALLGLYASLQCQVGSHPAEQKGSDWIPCLFGSTFLHGGLCLDGACG